MESWSWDKEFTSRLTNVVPLFFALGLFGWLTLSRIVRAQVLGIKEREFVEAAVALGYSKSRILFRHVVPNVLGPTIVYSSYGAGFHYVRSHTLFPRTGRRISQQFWGVLIKEGANFLETEIQLLLLPGLFFSLTLFSLNFLGDGLRRPRCKSI